MHSFKRYLLAMGACLTLLLTMGSASFAFGQGVHVRWDIISIDFAANTASAGGVAFAVANDASQIRLTGSGTFFAPASGEGTSSHVTGGGTWATSGLVGTASGTYFVTGLVRFDQAPGTPPPPTDLVDNPAERSAGLAILRIAYSDGSRGILVVSCHFIGTPDSVLEGVTATKGFVDFFHNVPPLAGIDANRTLFHVR